MICILLDQVYAVITYVGSRDVWSYLYTKMPCFFFFFFQAEDGIRDYKVTGVQTCALPIYRRERCGGTGRRRNLARDADRYHRTVLGDVGNRHRDVLAFTHCPAAECLDRVAEIGRASCRERV